MNLCINIGNNNILLGTFVKEKLLNPLRISHKTLVDVKAIFPVRKPENIIISSVIPNKNELFSTILYAIYGIKPEFITPKLLNGSYASMGADRIANLLGGKKLLGPPVCVIDFGTATTIDVLDKNNRYSGGIIMPGIQTGIMALHNSTALLPLMDDINKTNLKTILQRTTKECIESGVYLGEYNRIKGLTDSIKKQFNPHFVVTGGMGEKLAELLNFDYNSWLTLYGLNCSI
ncbi:MAG: type III pantothenate kinase [bacterium]|nr:type III pantothenate kinase [bacterium]